MPKTNTTTADAFAAALVVAKTAEKAGAESKPRKPRKPKAPPASKPRAGSRTVSMLREIEKAEGRNYARELAESLDRELENSGSEVERMRRSLRALATNLRTVAEEIDDILAIAGDEGVLHGARIMEGVMDTLNRRSGTFSLSLAKACGLIGHDEYTRQMIQLQEYDVKDSARWEPKGGVDEAVVG